MPKKTEDLEDHILSTYATLRWGIGWLAFALPLVLSILGFLLFKIVLQDSISAYYHAHYVSPGGDAYLQAGQGQMRNFFVGILWAIGVFLILYKGYGDRENYALDIAGVLLICVAMFPMGWTCRDACSKISIHGVSAVLFFAAIGYVCIFRSGDTLELVRNPAAKKRYKRTYRTIGLVMWLFPTVIFLFNFLQIYPFGHYTVLIVEVAGIWTFAAYWLLKGFEINATRADEAALRGHLEPPMLDNVSPFKKLFDTTPHILR